jgi:cytochrome c
MNNQPLLSALRVPAVLLLSALVSQAVHAAGDQTRSAGEKQFAKCAACHSLEPGVQLMGPDLANLKDRPIGKLAGFQFSLAMETATGSWDRESLSAFLENPARFLPGTVMPFGGLRNPEQRDALVTYLLEADQ